MLNELTTQAFLEILSEFQGEICGACMVACTLGTLLFWCLHELAERVFEKVFVSKKGRADNEKK